MGKRLLTGLIFTLITTFVSGQKAFDAEKTFFNADFNSTYQRYEKALDLYLKLFHNGYQNNNIRYRIGKTYLHIPGLKTEAIPWLEQAVEKVSAKYKPQSFKETKAPVEAWLLLGQTYQINNELEKARNAYLQYKRLLIRIHEDTDKADRFIASCDTAEKMLSKPRDTEISQPEFLKVTDMNYNATVSADGKRMVFMSDTRYYHAIYFTEYINGHWASPRNITMEVESNGNYRVSSLTADGATLLLSAPAGNNGEDIFISKFIRNRWSAAKPFSRKINSFHNEVYAFLSADQKLLLFVSDRPGGTGGLDIYEARKSVDGTWENILNLGTPVNTPYDENTPYLTRNGKRIYFSSNGHPGMGGYDVFISDLTSGQWGNPRNMGYPPNSTDDDLYFSPVEDASTGYMAVFDHQEKKKAEITAFEFFSENHPHTYAVTGKIKIQPGALPDEKAVIKVTDATHPDQIIKLKEIPLSGNFALHLPEGSYLLELSSPYLQTFTKPFVVKPDTQVNILEVSPVLARVPEKIQVKYRISTIYFDFNKATLNPDAVKTLRILKTAMDSLPGLVVTITGHTDAIGRIAYNQGLSERRADAVANYLTKSGISPARLRIKGFGETQPIAINHWPDGRDCPEGRQFNRRVSFSAEEADTSSIEFILPDVPVKISISGN
ncbi:MAG: OmpA family protein [Chlorobi bacterium]|nr:OmpA family protein [Chlorobiota bacterium]